MPFYDLTEQTHNKMKLICQLNLNLLSKVTMPSEKTKLASDVISAPRIVVPVEFDLGFHPPGEHFLLIFLLTQKQTFQTPILHGISG